MTAQSVRRALAAVSLMLAATGCYATASPDYVVTTRVPPDIYAYPSRVYDGRAVYWANDRWYYRRGGGWVYYRREPPELHQYRRQNRVYGRPYVEHAPPAYGPSRKSAPPATPRGSAPRSAPPARQVR